MSNHVWTFRNLFSAAVAIPEHLQEDYVRSSTAPDLVQQEVLELLKYHRVHDDEFLEPLDHPVIGDEEGFRHLGDYILEKRIASGGMGVVYRGRDIRLNRIVAIKLLNSNLSDTEDARNRMVHEARVAAKLQHEGIVQVYDVVDTDTNVAIISQFVKGGTVDDEIQSRPSLYCLQKDVVLVKGVAEALLHAHEAGVVHRDVKPSNILIDYASGKPKLTDFGIAKLLTQTDVLHTSAGSGTCFYMSPEQTLEDSEQISPVSDIFSLGIVFYELMTGHKPFDGPTRDVIVSRIRKGECQSPRALNPKIPRDLELVCMKMLEVEPRFRYQTCQELVADLDRYLQGAPVHATTPSMSRRVRSFVVTRRQFLMRTGMLAAGLTGGGYAAVRVLDKRSFLKVRSVSPATRIEVFQWIPQEYRFGLVSEGRGRFHSVRLGRGMYRITLRYLAGVREFDRMLEGNADSVELYSRPPDRAVANMVEVELPSGFPVGYPVSKDFLTKVRYVKPFRIDPTEVSCGAYHEFLQAKGKPLLPIWGDRLDPQWEALPVTQVSFTDASEYAEWVGKRLPTLSEWLLAACGPNGEPYPWGEVNPFEGGDLVEGGDLGHNAGVPFPEYGNWGQVDQRAQTNLSRADGASFFEENAWPVGRSSSDVRLGVKNLKGNVSEWTSTPLYVPDGSGDWQVSYGYRHICGHSWADQRSFGRRFTLRSESGDRIGGAVLDRGFRCAISI